MFVCSCLCVQRESGHGLLDKGMYSRACARYVFVLAYIFVGLKVSQSPWYRRHPQIF